MRATIHEAFRVTTDTNREYRRASLEALEDGKPDAALVYAVLAVARSLEDLTRTERT
jgi:uncharacterized membrane protein